MSANPSSPPDVAVTVLTILASIRPEEDFQSSNSFLDDGLLDSFDVVSLVSSLDQHFGISIEGAAIIPENFRNLDAIVALLARYRGAR